jgi:hypothetical protein
MQLKGVELSAGKTSVSGAAVLAGFCIGIFQLLLCYIMRIGRLVL